MRRCSAFLLIFAGLLCFAPFADAQKTKKTKITGIRIGYQAGLTPIEKGREYLYKAGQWTPVSVDISAGDDGLAKGLLEVETTDSDDVQNVYTVPLPALAAGEFYTATSYTKPGATHEDLTVRVRGEGQYDEYKKPIEPMELDDLLFVSIGSTLTGLKQALFQQSRLPLGANNPNVNQDGDEGDNSKNRGRVAHLETVSQLPTRWFAYQPVDLMIVTTGNAEFVNELLTQKPRVEALAEWVRRGGRVVLSTGRNQDLGRQLYKDLVHDAGAVDFVPGGQQATRLQGLDDWTGQVFDIKPLKPGDKPAPVELAQLKLAPARAAEVLVWVDREKTRPLIVRMPHGMGQIILVAFDLDQAPFTRWSGQNEFWKKLQVETGTGLVTIRQEGTPNRFSGQVRNDLAGDLRNNLEQFENVSNISFGWVALFIFIYILVVGPLDYFFLKKVVKRLELTWITFPTVVLVVSAVAYFTAYALKGNDLLINKVDVVDIDVQGKMAYGHTWFTLFSPRIQHYTVGIEPAAPDWVAEAAAERKTAGVLLSWMGRPDDSIRGYGRARSQSLFRRSYQYAPDATGLLGVPIQVWSMKSFAGSWERPLSAAQPPLIADLTLQKQGAANLFEGTITNKLPVDLENVYLVYGGDTRGGTWQELGIKLARGETAKVAFSPRNRQLADWAVQTAPDPGNFNQKVTTYPTDVIMRRMMLHDALHGGRARNLSVEELDESWRVRLKNEVMLIGRIGRMSAPSESVTAAPESASRLWLGKLPAPGETRPPIPGNMIQDTYVRAFLPIHGNAQADAP